MTGASADTGGESTSSGLYPDLFRRAILPTLDLLNRTNVSRCLRELESTQWLPADRLADLQTDKLARILQWTRRESEFYRRFWASASEDRRAASVFPELDGVAVVTKEDLRRSIGQFPLQSYRGRVHSVKTSGSTGQPMTYLRSEEQESMFWALRMRMWQWAGYVPGEPYLTLNLNPRVHWKKRFQDVLFRCSYHGFNANSHDVDAVLRDLERHRIKHLVGYASSLYLLASAMRRLGVSNPGVVTVLATGDTLLPVYRRTIEETFGVGVVDYYGLGGEGFHIASQCEERGLYHLHVENAAIEIIKEGRPARPGEMGELVVTQLDNRAMPLVRYATQDLAVPAGPETCACGRALPLLRGVEGRVPDIVFAPDGTALVVHFFTILFEYLSGVRQFQIVQSEPSGIVARLVTDDDYDRADTERRVRDAVAEATSGSLRVDFEYVPDIPLSPSNKRRLVISKVSSSLFATIEPGHDGMDGTSASSRS